MQKEIRVMLVGGFTIFRSGLKLLLEAEDNIRVIGEAVDLPDTADLIRAGKPNILLVDSSVADTDDFNSFVLAQPENISIIVITGSRDMESHRKYLLHGISGLVTKEENATVLFKAIDTVNRGEMWFVRKLLDETIKQLIVKKPSAPEEIYSQKCSILTVREREILSLICQGMKNKIIADALFISETTVRHHLTSMFEKLKVSSRLELVVHAFEEKFVEIPTESFKSSNKFESR